MNQKPMVALTVALLAGASACRENPVSPGTDRVTAGSPQALQSLVTGLTAQLRNGGATTSAGSAAPYFVFGNVMARDAIYPDPSETRWMTEFYESTVDPADFIGTSQWTEYYSVIRAAHTMVKDPALTSLPSAEQAAARGYVRVVEAMAYMRVIEYHDVEGAPIQGDDPTVADPFRTKQAVLAYTSALLDTAIADFTAAGGIQVPFKLPSGYSVHGDYSSTANLARLAHGLKGKAEVLRATDATAPNTASAATAITELNAALDDATTPNAEYLAKGPYFDYNPNAPENFGDPIIDSKLLLTDNFVNSIAPGDARAAMIEPAPRQSALIYSASYRSRASDAAVTSLSTPLPMIRNAELYLLRAQAKIVAGDLPGAYADINVVHTVEGGLPPLAVGGSATAAQDAVLYEYRYSFLFQGPQHLVALRSYKRLNAAYVGQPGIPTPGPAVDALTQTLPIPKGESDARSGAITPTA